MGEAVTLQPLSATCPGLLPSGGVTDIENFLHEKDALGKSLEAAWYCDKNVAIAPGQVT